MELLTLPFGLILIDFNNHSVGTRKFELNYFISGRKLER